MAKATAHCRGFFMWFVSQASWAWPQSKKSRVSDAALFFEPAQGRLTQAARECVAHLLRTVNWKKVSDGNVPLDQPAAALLPGMPTLTVKPELPVCNCKAAGVRLAELAPGAVY